MIRDSVGDWQELSALYEHADALGEAELADWLAEQRREPHRLLPQLEKMLAARRHVATGDFLQSLPRLRAEPKASDADWAEGSRIGAYRLIRHIGSGGMAEVWLAERADGAFERQVAIKLLFNHPTRAQRETFVERFKRERDILASLHHPNIASLHDAGVTPSGQPWLALEYVEGEPITAWCDSKRLTIEERVKVFRQVLLAVEHAHANLIIHRDLKPANILVTDQGEVKLLDFGIAKLMEAGGASVNDSELTRESGRPLTLHYASPEQLRSQPLTTASDVYSLGVVLYELLCGVRPFANSIGPAARLHDAAEAREAIPPSRHAPSEASAGACGLSANALAKALSGDLDAVTCKAMADAASRRYASVEALRGDLDRWCQHRPVLAKRASAGYRALKFYRRHRLGVWSSAVAIASVSVLGASTVVSGMKAKHEGVRAVASRDFVVDLFRLADPEQSKGRALSASELLDAGRKRALEMFAGQPDLRADVLRQIGIMQNYAGDHRRADANLADAAAIYARERRVRDWAMTQLDLADNAFFLGDTVRAQDAIVSVGRRIAEFAGDDALLAHYWFSKGVVSTSERQERAAIDELSLAVDLKSRAHGANHPDSIDALRYLANALSVFGRYPEALTRLDDASRRAAGNPAVGARDVFAVDAEMAITGVEAGQYGGGIERLSALITRCDASFGADEDHCVVLVQYLGWLSLRTGASETQQRLLPRLLAIAGNEAAPRRQAAAANTAGEVLAATGSLSDRPQLVDQLLAFARSPALARRERTKALLCLARDALAREQPDEAQQWAERALSLQGGPEGPDADLVAAARLLRGLSLHARGQHAEALDDVRAAIRRLEAAVGVGHTLAAIYRSNLAPILLALGRRDEAVQVLQASLATLASVIPEAPRTRRLQELLAAAQAAGNNLRTSEVHL